MNLERSGQVPQTLSMNPSSACTHSRLISDCVTKEERQVGKVRCVECGSIILDPHLQWDATGT